MLSELAGALLGAVVFVLVLRAEADWSRIPGPTSIGWLLAIALLIVETVAVWRGRAVLARALGRGVLMVCTFFVAALPVATVWSAGSGGYYAVGGMVPWSDAASWYQGAVQVKDHAKLDAWNQRRPINAALDGFKLRVGGSMQGWTATAAFLLAAALALAVRETALLLGLPAAAVFLASVSSHAEEYLATAMSEPNGLFFGLLAAAVLIAAIRLHSTRWFLCGLFLLSLALDVRPGAMFVLPLLGLWGAMVFGKDLKGRLRILALAALVTILGFVPGRLYGALWGTGTAAVHSNFSLTFYGLADGNSGWHQASIDYPPERFANEREHSKFLYGRAFELIREHPWRFAKTLLRNLLFFLARLDLYLKLQAVVTALVLILCLWRRDATSSFLLVVFGGITLSAPFLVRDAEFRLFAATVPLTALIPAVAVMLLQTVLRSVGSKSVEAGDRSRSTFAPIAAVVLAAFAVTAPLLAAGGHDVPPLPPVPERPGEWATVFVPGESGDWVDVVPDRQLERSRVPVVRRSDILADLLLTELKHERLESRAPFSFGVAVDARGISRHPRMATPFVTPSGVHLPRAKRPLLLVGEERAAENEVYYLEVNSVYELSRDGRSWMPVLSYPR